VAVLLQDGYYNSARSAVMSELLCGKRRRGDVLLCPFCHFAWYSLLLR